MVVAIAAPGNPKKWIRVGQSTILQPLAIQSDHMAIDALPAPLNTPLIRNSIMMTALLPKIVRVYGVPSATALGEAPITRRIQGASKAPEMLITTVAISAITIDCAAVCEA